MLYDVSVFQSFSLSNNTPLYGIPCFIPRSLFDEHFGCLHFSIIKNSVAMSVCVRVFLDVRFISLGYLSRGIVSGLHGHSYVQSFEEAYTVFKVAEPFCIHISSVLGS